MKTYELTLKIIMSDNAMYIWPPKLTAINREELGNAETPSAKPLCPRMNRWLLKRRRRRLK
jgi:hypothetical protein